MWEALASNCGITICVTVMVIWTSLEILFVSGIKTLRDISGLVICGILLQNSIFSYFGVGRMGWFTTTVAMVLSPFDIVAAVVGVVLLFALLCKGCCAVCELRDHAKSVDGEESGSLDKDKRTRNG